MLSGGAQRDRRGDVEILQLKAVTALRRVGLIGKSRLVQNRIHEFAGGIAGERASGAVRAVGSGREAEHQDTRVGIAEARNRLSPILPIEVGAALLARDSLAIFDQARTAGAGNHFAIQLIKPGGHSSTLYAGRVPQGRDAAFVATFAVQGIDLRSEACQQPTFVAKAREISTRFNSAEVTFVTSVFGLAGLTLLSSSLYTQIYSPCRSMPQFRNGNSFERPKLERQM